MKTTILITFLCVVGLTANAQPPFHITPANGKVTLKGKAGGVTSPTEVDIYKGTSNPPEELYTTIPFGTGNEYQWEDTNVENGTFYFYRVKVRNGGGAISNFSRTAGAMPIKGGGNYALLDGNNDFLRRTGNILSGLTKISFLVRIENVPTSFSASTKHVRIMTIQNQFYPNYSYINVTHGPVLRVNMNKTTLSPGGGTSTDWVAHTKNIGDGKWHKVVIYNIGSTNTKVLVDDIEYSLNNASQAVHFQNEQELSIGGDPDANLVTFMKGGIDQIKTWTNGNLKHDWRLDEVPGISDAWDSGPTNQSLSRLNGAGWGGLSNFGTISAISEPEQVSLSWGKDVDTSTETLQAYEIWRKVNDGTLSFLKNINKEINTYIDTDVSLGETYEYEVRSIKSNGIIFRSETDVSKPVKGFDRYLVLDGVGEVQVPDSELFSDNNGTIEFRLKASLDDIESGKPYSVINKHDATGSLNGFNFILDRSRIYVQIKDNGSNNKNVRPANSVPLVDGEWHHVALTYEWGGSSILYIDGEPVDTLADTPSINLSDEPFRMGKSPASFWNAFKGGLDEVRVWDAVLTSTEIAERKDKLVNGDGDGLQAMYRFDTPIASGVVNDGGTNGFDGILVGNLSTALVPSGIVYASYDGSDVTLGWNFQSESPISTYTIRRATTLGDASPPQILGTVNAPTSGFTDNTAIANQEYEYTIDAVTGNGPITATDYMATKQDLGNRLYFDGVDGIVEIDETLTDNTTGTIEFRFRTDQDPPTGKSYSLLNRHDEAGSANGFNFVLSPSGLAVQLKVEAVNTNLFYDADLIDGEWHHAALVYDWNGENKLIVDGSERVTQTISNLQISSEKTRIGSSQDPFWSPYKGQIDELRIWNRKLSESEINTSKDLRLPGSTNDLDAVWHFDEQRGYLVARDEGANNFDGLLKGGASFNQDLGTLSFSSSTNGFMETLGNAGRIEGSMVIEVSGNFFRIPENSGRIVDQSLYTIPQQIFATPPSGGSPVQASLLQGLTPVLSINENGTTATLHFEGQADFHAADYSQGNLYIELDSDIFLTDNAVAFSNGANTNISYTLRDNSIPLLDQPIPDVELFVNDTEGVIIDLNDHFSDPDFEQEFSVSVVEESALISTIVAEPAVLVNVDSRDPGTADLIIIFKDDDGGSVSDTLTVSINKQPQSITFNPIGVLSLPDDDVATLAATASSGLPVTYGLLEGDGFINNGVLTASNGGVFTIVALQEGNDTYATADSVFQTITVIDMRKQDQTISFIDDIKGLKYGDGPNNLFATSSSGLPVTYSSSGPIAIDGASFSILGAGEASISANQAGDDDFNPAQEVTIDFNIAKATLTATADDQTRTYLTNNPVFTITYKGFVGDDLPQSLMTEPIAASGTLPTTDVGNYPIVASGGTDANYDFIYIDGTLTIEKADQVLNFDAIPGFDIADTNQVKLIALSSVENLVVNYTLDAGDGSIVDDIVTVNNSGTFIVRATQEGNSNYNPAADVTQSFNVIDSRKTDQTITFTTDLTGLKYGDGDIMLSANSTSGLEVNFVTTGPIEINGNQLSIIGAGDASVTAIQDGDTEVNPATPVTVSFNIAKAELVASVEEIQRTYKEENPPFSLLYEGFVRNDKEIDIDQLPVASTLATIDSDAGLYEITLSGGSDNNYEFELINGTLTIIKAMQFIYPPVVGIIDLSSENQVSLVSSTTSGLPVTLELLSGDGIIADNQILTINNTGTFTVKYSQPGNTNYEAAPDVILSIQAIDSRKSDQSISFEVIESKAYGDQIALTASASSGLAISYQLVSGEGSLENGVLTITGVGEYEIMATQDGDDSFNPAGPKSQLFVVSKAPLTVQASDQTIAEGEALPTLTVDYDGFVFSDGVDDLAELPVASTLATTESPAGEYEIAVNGGSDDLYEFILVNGTLTITSQQILGIEEIQVSTYPNPTTRFIYVLGGEFTDFQLISMDGKLVKHGRLSKDIDVRDLRAGQYLLKLSDEKGRTSAHRIIKK